MANKIIFSGGTEFSAAAYPVETEPGILAKRALLAGESREVLRMTVTATAAAVMAAFTDGASYWVRQFSADGLSYVDYDKSEYCIAGEVVDHRDGRITVYMGKKTAAELRVEALEAENARLLFENLTGGEY